MAKTLLVQSPIEDVLGDDPEFIAEVKAIRAGSRLRKDARFMQHHLARAASRPRKSAVGRNEIVAAVAGHADLSKSAASKAVEAVFESIAAALKGGGEVRLVGFGTFSVSRRAASEGRNPRTGEKIRIAASKQTKFKPGQRLRDQIN
jgi:DNA-binding protein HU-beta